MKILEIDPAIILEVYVEEVRYVLELAVPAWHSGLTREQSLQIEKIQKLAVNIILNNHQKGVNRLSYSRSLNALGLESLEERRFKLCKNFAKKCLKSRHTDMFQENPSVHQTRSKKLFSEHQTFSERAFMSPLVYLTKLLNSMS